jgi:hypothetical protein
MGRYIDKENVRAEEMFERLIGYSYAVTSYEEIHSYNRKHGSQIQLSREPIVIESCEGYLKYEPLKLVGWTNVPIETLVIKGRGVDVPPSIFGAQFAKVKIKYTAGEVVIPREIKEAVEEICELLEQPDISSWNLPLSLKTLLTIEKYKKKHERG